ncbi:hypothetical protein PIB30_102626, partial [Stylosanthes scabra]|nr:hypothetical protein [Stylosanthes scabra]
MGHPVERIEMFYPNNGMDFRFILPADLPAYVLNCFVGCSNEIICLALPVLDGVCTFMVWNPITNRHIVIQDTFYLDTEKTISFYAFGHHYLSTDYPIVHVYSMANKIGEMKMHMYNSSSAQWSVDQDAPSFIHYFDGAPVVCNGVLHWVNKVIEERPFPRSIVTYSLNAGTRNEVLILQEAKQEFQFLVIQNRVPALVTHPDHLDEFDVNIWYIKHTPTGVNMLDKNIVVHNSGFGETPKTIIDVDMITIFESVNDIVPFGPNGYLRVV